VVITEEVDIKPVILGPPTPPSHPENGSIENGEEEDRNDMSEIDILMDELLKDVEVNVAAEPREVSQTKPASLGLSIRKDIFMSPKKEVIELGDSPPKSGVHENPQVAHASSSGSMMITSSAAQIMQSAVQLNQQGISGSMWAQPDSRLQGGHGMIPLRNIAPKPTMSSSQVNFPQHHLQQQLKQQQQQFLQQLQQQKQQQQQQQQQQAPSYLPLTLPNLQQQQAALMKPASVSQTDMRVAYEQLKALEALQAGKRKREVQAKQWDVPAAPAHSGEAFKLPLDNAIGFHTNAAEFLFQPEVVKDRPQRTYKRYNRDNRTPLFHDPTLPPGWSRKVTQRMTGATAGGWDTYLMDPTGKRFRSKQEVRRHFERIGEVFLRWEDFDFNPFGSKGQVIEEDQNIPFWEEPGDLDPSHFLDDNFHCPQGCGLTFSSREECLSHEVSCTPAIGMDTPAIEMDNEPAIEMDPSQFLKTEILE